MENVPSVPRFQTNPAVTETITYCYDQLNRLTSKSYSAQSCPMSAPDASFTYDVSSSNGLSNLGNPIGRLVAEANPSASTVSSFDSMGRITSQWQCGPFSCATQGYYPLGFTYDKVGNLLTHSYSRDLKTTYTYSYTYDNASRLAGMSSSFVDSTHPAVLLTSAVYNAAGDLSSDTLGNGIAEIRTYDSRLRLTSITAGSAYSVSMNYAPNGDILSSSDSVNGNFTYTYDDFNRLVNMNNCQNVYDRYGNRWQENGNCWSNPSFSFSQNNNHMDGFSYDAVGNLLGRQGHTYSYDPENRIAAVDGGSLSQYVYDASGRRVGNTNWTVAGSVEYFYDLQGRQFDMTIYTGGGRGGDRSYIYAGDRHLASYYMSVTAFNHTDWLGTMRRATAADGSVYQNSINANPWGEELYYPDSQGDASLLHFTDKEVDDEDNLVYFGGRYYDPYQPRFMTADWAEKPEAVPYADLLDPQSLNLYTYVRNNPVSRTDPDGHCPQGPGCVMEVVEIISRATSDPVGFVKSFFIGAGKQELATIRDNVGMSPSSSLEPSNDVERAGAAATQTGQEVGAVVLPLVTGGEGEEPSGTFMGPKEGSANGEGAGQPISPANKQAAVDQNVAANGGTARCVFCGQRVSNEPGPNRVNIDHAQAKSNGGNNTLDNAQVTCQFCNQSKGTASAPKTPKPKPPQQPQ